MDQNELKTLRLLEVLEQHETKSQRDLSMTLNMSLGLVNAFLKRLYNKGYFKIKNLPRNRVKYILTPKGVAEKSRLTYRYIMLSISFYRDTRKKLESIFKDLDKSKIRRIVFFGVSELAEIAYIVIQEFDFELVGVVDNENAGKKFMREYISDDILLKENQYDALIVTKLKPDSFEIDNIIKCGVPKEKIFVI